MDLLEPGELADGIARPTASTTTDDRSAAPPPPSLEVRAAIAGLALVAAVIHLAMIPSHAGSSAVEATGFAVSGWTGIALAAAVLLRPGRTAIGAAAGVHTAIVVVWLWSRTVGLPVGAHAGHPAEFTAIDIVANLAGVGVVVFCLAALGGALHSLPRTLSTAAAAVAVTAAVAAASLALAAPSTRDHDAASHGDHAAESAAHDHDLGTPGAAPAGAAAAGGTAIDHGHDPATPAVAAIGGAAEVAATGHGHDGVTQSAASVDLAGRCDLGFNTVGFWEEHQLVHGGLTTAAANGSAELDALIRETTRPGAEAKDAQVIVQLEQASDEAYAAWLNWLPSYLGVHHSSAAPGDNAGHGGHLGPQQWTPMTDPFECNRLADELAQAKDVALRYPTPADAQAAGWVRVTGYVPGIAAHYMNFRYVDETFDIAEPEMLLYDGDQPTSSIVGLSYYLLHDSDYEPTQGFTGPNDHFHRHIGLCVNGTGVIGDTALSDEECAARGGTRSGFGGGGWMNHVWIVPGCESPWGLFSAGSPRIDRALQLGTGTTAGGCAASSGATRFDLTPGGPDNVPAAVIGRSATE